MPLHDEVGINCKKFGTTDVKEQMPSICSKGCMFDNSACLIGLRDACLIIVHA